MKPTGVLRELGFININNNIKKMSSFTAQTQPVCQSRGAVILAGHLKKLKTLKKKYFVLRAEAIGHPACLEYYDNKKKYDNKQPPKRSISVRSCFNINKRRDTKHKHVIALYTKDDCFCLVLDNEKDLEEWLKKLLLLQNGDQPDGEQPRPTFGTYTYFSTSVNFNFNSMLIKFLMFLYLLIFRAYLASHHAEERTW